MGVLRALLALSVVLSHLGGFFGVSLTGGFSAVQMFYIISGFYMATILTEKYDPRADIAVFYSNRFLRIYSIYFVCLAFSIVLYAIVYAAGHDGWMRFVVHNIGRVEWWQQLWLALAGLFVVTQEWTLFMVIGDGGLAFTTAEPAAVTPPWHFMPVPQAWSISLELMFYALVPFLIRNRTPVLIAIMAATFVLRIAAYANGFEHDPWMSRFFPFELGLFVMGMVSRRVYDAYIEKIPRRTQIIIAVSFVALSCILRELLMHVRMIYVIWPYYFSALIALPCLFHLTRHNKMDTFIGSFSYPLYLIHWVILMFYDAFAAQWGLPFMGSNTRVAICLVVSTLLAWAVVVSVEVPLDRFRQRRLVKAAVRHG
jgi:peptidoglycan/LPS O-acetylase OafA/YrhL